MISSAGQFPFARDAPRLLREGIDPWIAHGADVAIVDVPVHRNAGDLFIYAATEWLLRQRECRVVYRAGVRDYRSTIARRVVHRDAVVVGLGGGNFGDLYPRYQALRAQVVRDFPANRIVVLPQSIHFARPDALEAHLAPFRRHPDFRIAVRDESSLAVARTITPHVQLLPDVVDAVGASALPDTADQGGGHGTLHLCRQDAERDGHEPWAAPRSAQSRSCDWPALLPGLRVKLALAATLMPLAAAGPYSRVHAWWQDVAHTSLVRAVERVRQFDRVVTDRLHGAIVARLAGRPVMLVDNSYGKLSAYYDTWWASEPDVTLHRRAPRNDRDV